MRSMQSGMTSLHGQQRKNVPLVLSKHIHNPDLGLCGTHKFLVVTEKLFRLYQKVD